MQVRTYSDATATARATALYIQRHAAETVDAVGRFTLALSGGRTPWLMLRHLAQLTLPWQYCHIFQVDERIAPHGDELRNLTHIERNLLQTPSVKSAAIHAMPVESSDLDAACDRYSATLIEYCDTPPVLDLVLLGLGSDGHTASLVPGDPVLDLTSDYVGVTGLYRNSRRMTLTFSVLNNARQIVWLVTGAEKKEILEQLLKKDASIPAGQISTQHAIVFADSPAVPDRCEIEKTRV